MMDNGLNRNTAIKMAGLIKEDLAQIHHVSTPFLVPRIFWDFRVFDHQPVLFRRQVIYRKSCSILSPGNTSLNLSILMTQSLQKASSIH